MSSPPMTVAFAPASLSFPGPSSLPFHATASPSPPPTAILAPYSPSSSSSSSSSHASRYRNTTARLFFGRPVTFTTNRSIPIITQPYDPATTTRCAPTPRMMISSNDFRPGTTIELEGVVFRVLEFLHVKPGKGAAFVRTKLKNMKTGNNVDKTFKAGEMVPQAQLEKSQMQHTYVDGDDYIFMNMETYEEERLSRKVLGERVVSYLVEGMEVEVLKHNEDVLGVDIPKSLIVTVASTDPGVKGNTVQGGSKPATLESGALIQVPLFINSGDKIVVNTEENVYLSRHSQ